MKISCHLFFIFAVTLLSALTQGPVSANMRFIKLNTVDKDLTPVKPQLVRWWFSDNINEKTTINCHHNECSNLHIAEEATHTETPITIFALQEKAQTHDKECWDWYEAEAEIPANQSKVTLVLEHKSTVCK
ncbi:MAG: hypothetical protein K0U68_02590 [Gammaproteobacteria bacterium]|nr:hypothetical protein [Gammaproteobacteria bacterium]